MCRLFHVGKLEITLLYRHLAMEDHLRVVPMTKKKRSASSSRWLQEHVSDPFVQKAQKLGLRSRAAFKLDEIQRKR